MVSADSSRRRAIQARVGTGQRHHDAFRRTQRQHRGRQQDQRHGGQDRRSLAGQELVQEGVAEHVAGQGQQRQQQHAERQRLAVTHVARASHRQQAGAERAEHEGADRGRYAPGARCVAAAAQDERQRRTGRMQQQDRQRRRRQQTGRQARRPAAHLMQAPQGRTGQQGQQRRHRHHRRQAGKHRGQVADAERPARQRAGGDPGAGKAGDQGQAGLDHCIQYSCHSVHR